MGLWADSVSEPQCPTYKMGISPPGKVLDVFVIWTKKMLVIILLGEGTSKCVNALSRA